MRKIHFLVPVLLALFLSLCKPHQKSELVSEVDSLILLTLEMQQRISSPEIQRLSEFQDKIILDLEILDDSIEYGTDPSQDLEGSSGLLGQYRVLNENLTQCLRACSYFHEEAFLLENTITEIKNQAELKDADQEGLKELLDAEWANYHGLSFRIDSSLENVAYHAEMFYSLRSGIDSMLAQAKNPTLE